jgi:DNA-binding MarR family transcriptional regulator
MPRRPTTERGLELLDHPERSLGFLIKQVHHLMRLGIEERMRAAKLDNMTHAHAVVLHSLTNSPGASGAALARDAMVTPQTMNGILVNLESQGLIERRPDPSHGRILGTFITDKGLRHLARGVAAAEGFLQLMEGVLTSGERQELRRVLLKCLKSLGQITGVEDAERAGLRPLKPAQARGVAATSQRA